MSPKFEGPYRVLEILKHNKLKLIRECDNKESIQHYNKLKLLNINDTLEFPQIQEDANVEQDSTSASAGRYNLRSRT